VQPFLTATWKNLLNLTYPVDPDVVTPYLPDGVTLDVQDGKAFVSVVAFDFLDTRIHGMRIPFHVNFPEINLRFYVRYHGIRGVVFIREYVPRYFIAKTAKLLYNEPYQSVPMRSHYDPSQLSFLYEMKFNNQWFRVQVKIRDDPDIPSQDSREHYFKEHEWGFGSDRKGRTKFYQVKHPVWQTYPIEKVDHNLEFDLLYGDEWEFLNATSPLLAIFAKGSAVEVFPNQDITLFE
jgi:uncharacterized protein YqjF (DUF2071 family)